MKELTQTKEEEEMRNERKNPAITLLQVKTNLITSTKEKYFAKTVQKTASTLIKLAQKT